MPVSHNSVLLTSANKNSITYVRNLPRSTSLNLFFPLACSLSRGGCILVPVERPQDLAKAGSGTIKLQDRYGDPLRVTGLGTKFTKELFVGDQISLPKDVGSSAVVEIISDTELIVKKEFKDLKALELLTSPEGSKYKCLPHMDQSNVYKTVFERLNAGHCVGIFPEGGSHDRAEMLPLKGTSSTTALPSCLLPLLQCNS